MCQCQYCSILPIKHHAFSACLIRGALLHSFTGNAYLQPAKHRNATAWTVPTPVFTWNPGYGYGFPSPLCTIAHMLGSRGRGHPACKIRSFCGTLGVSHLPSWWLPAFSLLTSQTQQFWKHPRCAASTCHFRTAVRPLMTGKIWRQKIAYCCRSCWGRSRDLLGQVCHRCWHCWLQEKE